MALETSSIIPSNFKTDCGYYFKKADFLPNHNPITFVVGGIPDKLNTPNYAMSMYWEIQQAFAKKDCQAAAVFIGTIMHVIADATYYKHLLDYTYYEEVLGIHLHREIKDHVNHVTFRKWDDALGANRVNEFFNLAEVKNKLTANDMFNPSQATLRAGKDTRFGGEFYEDAHFLAVHQPTQVDHKFWTYIPGGWTDYPDQDTWTHSERPTVQGATYKRYFDTLEHNLNQAVYCCATALNWVINFAGYTNCDCGSGSGQYPNPPSSDGGGEDDLKEGIRVSVDQLNGLLFFNIIGLMASVLAIALLNKVDIIEALIPL